MLLTDEAHQAAGLLFDLRTEFPAEEFDHIRMAWTIAPEPAAIDQDGVGRAYPCPNRIRRCRRE